MVLSIHPLTKERFPEFERLFGASGAYSGCWCMFWKLRGKAFEKSTGSAAHEMQKSYVETGGVPGLIAYDADQPVGWIAIEPRSEYLRLAHSKVLQAIDAQPVWSVTCFFVDKRYRHKGLMVKLLRAAIEYVKAKGGRIVEGYPLEAKGKLPSSYLYTGNASTFRKAGFTKAGRNVPHRPIYRHYIGG